MIKNSYEVGKPAKVKYSLNTYIDSKMCVDWVFKLPQQAKQSFVWKAMCVAG